MKKFVYAVFAVLLIAGLAFPVFAATTAPSWVSTESQNRVRQWFLKDQQEALYSTLGDLTDAGGFWATVGNTGTTAGTHFIGTVDARDLVFKAHNTEVFRLADGANATWTGDGATDTFNLLVGNLKVGNGTPDLTLSAEDAYVEGTLEVDGAVRHDSTLDQRGDVSDGGGVYTVADNVLVDGAADAVQFTVQGFTAQTNNIFVVEESGGADRFTVNNVGDIAAAGALVVGDDITLENDETISNSTDGDVVVTLPAAGSLTVDTGNFTVGDETPTYAMTGEDAYIEGGLEVDGPVYADGGLNLSLIFNMEPVDYVLGGIQSLTPAASFYTLDPAEALTLTLTVNSANAGDLLFLTNVSTYTVTVSDTNVLTSDGSVVTMGQDAVAVFIFVGASWYEIALSDNS